MAHRAPRSSSDATCIYVASEYAFEINLFSSCHSAPLNIIIHAVTIPLEWASTLLLLRAIAGFTAAYIASAAVIVYYVMLLLVVRETEPELGEKESSSSPLLSGSISCECAVAAAVAWNLATILLITHEDAATTILAAIRADSYLIPCWHTRVEPAFAVFALTQLSSWLMQVGLGHVLSERNSPSMVKRLTANSAILSPVMAFHDVFFNFFRV